MSFRETLVISNLVLVAFAVFVLAQAEGILTEWGALGGFILVAVIGFGAPQLYFALSRDDHLSRIRIRLIPPVVVVVGVFFSLVASPRELLVIWSVVVLSVFALVGSELRSGFLAG